jgi:hypothetical protein
MDVFGSKPTKHSMPWKIWGSNFWWNVSLIWRWNRHWTVLPHRIWKWRGLMPCVKNWQQGETIGEVYFTFAFLRNKWIPFPICALCNQRHSGLRVIWTVLEISFLLHSFGFKILYTCMDGAHINRSFMHICLRNSPKSFISTSPCTSYNVISLWTFHMW